MRFGDGQVEVASLARAIEDGLIAFARAPVRSESVAPAALGVLALALEKDVAEQFEEVVEPRENQVETLGVAIGDDRETHVVIDDERRIDEPPIDLARERGAREACADRLRDRADG